MEPPTPWTFEYISSFSKKMENITLKELARILGLSVSTVSKALNDSYEISQKTKARVIAAAKEYNYQPNISAKSLKTGKSRTLGVIIPLLSNPFQSQILEGAHQAAYTNNYKLVFMQSRENPTLERESIQSLLGQHVDGILISPCADTDTEFLRATAEKKPTVLIDRIDFDIDTNKIGVDSELGAFQATQHLIDQRRKDILVLAGRNIGVTQKRLSGYRKALLANYIEYREDYVIHVDYGMTVDDLRENLAATISPTISRLHLQGKAIGILGTTDTLTVSILGILDKLRIKVPEHIAVIGFANTQAAESMNPSLSTIVQPAIEMGYQGIEKLIHSIESKSPINDQSTTTILKPSIVYRNSTRV